MCDVISIYRSQEEKNEIVASISKLVNLEKPTIILGDVNLNLLKDIKHPMLDYLDVCNFSQLVQCSTHQQGGLLDPVFASHHFQMHEIDINQKCVYYSDHDLIHVNINFQNIDNNLED